MVRACNPLSGPVICDALPPHPLTLCPHRPTQPYIAATLTPPWMSPSCGPYFRSVAESRRSGLQGEPPVPWVDPAGSLAGGTLCVRGCPVCTCIKLLRGLRAKSAVYGGTILRRPRPGLLLLSNFCLGAGSEVITRCTASSSSQTPGALPSSTGRPLNSCFLPALLVLLEPCSLSGPTAALRISHWRWMASRSESVRSG